MIENKPENVLSAFEIVLEEIEAEIEFVNGIGAKGFETRDYENAHEPLERAARLATFRDQVAILRKEWEELAALADSQEDEETKRPVGILAGFAKAYVWRTVNTTDLSCKY
jgi:hypothetical protein